MKQFLCNKSKLENNPLEIYLFCVLLQNPHTIRDFISADDFSSFRLLFANFSLQKSNKRRIFTQFLLSSLKSY